MAFNPANVTSATATPAPVNDSWKAQAFLNFYLPRQDGSRAKLGAIGLKMAKPNEKTLIEWLNADPANIQKLVNKLEVEFKSVEPTEGSGFDLG